MQSNAENASEQTRARNTQRIAVAMMRMASAIEAHTEALRAIDRRLSVIEAQGQWVETFRAEP